jgi:hypothetical protein
MLSRCVHASSTPRAPARWARCGFETRIIDDNAIPNCNHRVNGDVTIS